MIFLEIELTPEVERGYEVKNGNYMYNEPRARVIFTSNLEQFYDKPIISDDSYEIASLNGSFNIYISIDHLSSEIQKFVLLELNDDFKLGSLLGFLGIIKSSGERLGDTIYVLEDVKKEYVYDLYFYLLDSYYKAIEKYKTYEIERKELLDKGLYLG